MSNVLAHYGSMDHGEGWGPFAWVFFLLFMAALIAGVVVLVVWIVGARSPRSRPVGVQQGEPGRDDALATLRTRYARGELTRDEFAQMSEDLGAPLPPPPPSS
jgi:uncharacterized membrane protein